MEAIVKRTIERRLKAMGMSHKQALMMVSILNEVDRDLRIDRRWIERITDNARAASVVEPPRG